MYKRFDRWSERGVWQEMFEYFADDPDMESVMLDSSVIRAHACAAGAPKEKGGKKRRHSAIAAVDKVHMSIDALGNPLRILLTAGQAHEAPHAKALLEGYEAEFVMADKAYDAEAILLTVAQMGAEPVIPPKSTRKEQR